MDKAVKSFLSRLKTVKSKACDERVTLQTVYNRIKAGIYDSIEIDGVKFVVEPETEPLSEEPQSAQDSDWRKDFGKYMQLVDEAKAVLLADNEFRQKMEQYYPNMDFELSVDKSVFTFWGTEAGWQHKKKARRKGIDMLSTLKRTLNHNIVYRRRQYGNASDDWAKNVMTNVAGNLANADALDKHYEQCEQKLFK